MVRAFIGAERALTTKYIKNIKSLVEYEMNLMESASFSTKEVEFLKTLPLLDEHRVLILEMAEGNELLMDFLKDVPSTAYLVIVADKLDRRSKLYKYLSVNKLITDCNKFVGAALLDWMRERKDFFSSVCGTSVEISDEQLKSIAERSGYTSNDDVTLFTLEVIIQQLVYTAVGTKISSSQMDDIIGDCSASVVWSLTNCIVRRDQVTMLSVANKLLDNGENVIGMLSAILYTFRVAYKYTLFKNGVGANVANNPFLCISTCNLKKVVGIITKGITDCKSGYEPSTTFIYTLQEVFDVINAD